MITMEIAVLLLAAYIIGSMPTGLIIGKLFFKTDVRNYGSKNIGATNTFRVLGLKAALPVFLGDAGKGALGVLLFYPNPEWMIAGGLCAMIGHNWSIFLKFSGGRGVATGLGVLIALSPVVAAICFAVWAVIVKFTSFVSLGSIVAAVLVPVLMYVMAEPVPYIIFGGIAAAFVVFRHRENIVRLLQGKELAVKRIKKDDSP